MGPIRWCVLALLLVSLLGCASGPAVGDPDGRALAFMESRAREIDANREALELVVVRLETLSGQAVAVEARVGELAAELGAARQEIKARDEQLQELRGAMQMAQARLSATSDALKELHAWTQGVIKNRRDLEELQDAVGRAHERLDVLAGSLEGLRSTSAAVAVARGELSRLDESLLRTSQSVEQLAETAERLEDRAQGFTRAQNALAKLVQGQRQSAKELDALRASLERLGAQIGEESVSGDTAAERLESILSRLSDMSLQGSRAGSELDEMRGLLKVLDKRVRTIETGEAPPSSP
ncbi:MAG: hypothetical protein AB1486_23235 [Planctomycetota bacterium]